MDDWDGVALNLYIMKIIWLIFGAFLITATSRGVDTNTIVSINLPTTLDYDVHFSGSKDDSTPHFVSLVTIWQSIGKSGRKENYTATIENFPFIRTRWKVQDYGNDHMNQFGAHIAFVPLYPIQGRVRILAVYDNYDQLGNPDSHGIKYLWVTNSLDKAEQEAITARAFAGALADKKRAEQGQVSAVKWLQPQATNGDASAQCSLGIHYLNGQGCETNRELAIYWLKKAADQGSTEASNKLVTLKP